jgi:hypothetical protein
MSAVLVRAQPVLVMSAQRAVRELLRRLLGREGYSCSAVSDGDEAFAAIARARPLVAVLDMRVGTDDDLLFLGLLRKRIPDLGAIVLLPGRSLVRYGRTEHVMENDAELRGPNLPSLEQLRQAIDWIATQTMLATWKPPAGSA